MRYLRYSFMIFGHNYIDRGLAAPGRRIERTRYVPVNITSLGGHPSLKIGSLLETHKHNVDEILREALMHEEEGLGEYHKLLGMVEGRNIMLEEYARVQIAAETAHVADLGKMLRKPGSIA